MNCPHCGYQDSKVIDSRDVNDGIRRRRQCLECQARFTTYERLQPAALLVIKKDGRREEFQREKLLAGILKAGEKRPVPNNTLTRLADDIEAKLYLLGRAEVGSNAIGDLVMEGLHRLDHIAYIRFASVYRDFADITELKQVVDKLATAAPPPGTAQLVLLPEEEMITIRGQQPRLRRVGRRATKLN